MKVVLDSSVIVERDWMLAKPNPILLEQAIKLGKVQVVVPEIVVEEVKNKHREKLAELDKKSRAIAESFIEILVGGSGVKAASVDVAKASNDYQKHFDGRLKELASSSPSYEGISQKELVARALARRRPFTESGRGYRDALLWETVVKPVAGAEHETILVTIKPKDFCGSDGKSLHEDLADDLAARGLPRDCVKVALGWETLANYAIKPLLPENADVLVAIQENRFKEFDVLEFIDSSSEDIQRALTSELERAIGYNLPYELLEGATVSHIEDPVDVGVVEAYELDEKRIYLKYTLTANVSLDLMINKADYIWLREEYPLETWDSDWNEHTVWATMTAKLPLTISIILRLKPEIGVDEFEVKIDEFYGWCWNCEAPITSDAAEECSSCGKSLIRQTRRKKTGS